MSSEMTRMMPTACNTRNKWSSPYGTAVTTTVSSAIPQGKQTGEKDADGDVDTDIKLSKVQRSRKKLRLPQVLRSRQAASGCRMDKGSSTPP